MLLLFLALVGSLWHSTTITGAAFSFLDSYKKPKLQEGGQGVVPQPEGGPAVRVCEDQAGGGGGGDAPFL